MHGWEKKRAALELWRKTGEWLTPFWTAFCFRLPCVDRVDHETRLYAAQNINEAAGDPETCYLRRVIVHFWYRYFLFRLNLTREIVFFSSFSFFVDNWKLEQCFSIVFFFFFWIKLVKLAWNFFYFYTFAFKYALKYSKLYVCIYVFLRFLKAKEVILATRR